MTFEPDKVQCYRKIDGAERLVATNFYKRFERRVVEGAGIEVYIAQGGSWYSSGGDPIAHSDIPDWVWAECRAMDLSFRRFYRITLPEERQSGTIIPSVEVAPEWPTDADIMNALMQLDPASDVDWTEDGRPNLQAVRRILSVHVPRKRLDAVAPVFVRPVIHEGAD